jgi:hypothetical protein
MTIFKKYSGHIFCFFVSHDAIEFCVSHFSGALDNFSVNNMSIKKKKSLQSLSFDIPLND